MSIVYQRCTFDENQKNRDRTNLYKSKNAVVSSYLLSVSHLEQSGTHRGHPKGGREKRRSASDFVHPRNEITDVTIDEDGRKMACFCVLE